MKSGPAAALRAFFRDPHRIALTLLLLAGAAVRFWSVWRYRHQLNLDAGVVALMVRHISRGEAFPVFFYGQPHMGSLEAMFSGLFAAMFGLSGYMVGLGTAFVSFFLLPVTYVWARMVSGKQAGLQALALCVIGPGGFFHYNGSPRGGYAGALTFGAWMIFCATRMVLDWRRNGRQSGLWFFLLGLGAGLGWWSSQLTTASILAAGLLLLAGLGRHAFTWRIFSGAGGFFLGSLPLWLYNLRNDWATFGLSGSFRAGQQLQGLVWFFRDRSASLMIPGYLPGWGQALLAAFYLLLALWCGWLLIQCRRRRDPAGFWGFAGIYLFTAIFAILYASSHFAVLNTPRYFLPMVAPLAVLAGAGLSRLPVAPRWGWLAVAPVVAVQLPTLWHRGFEFHQAALMERVEEMAETLREQEVRIVYTPVHQRAWNAALKEEFLFVDLRHNFYAPHAREAELAEDVAVFHHFGSPGPFVHRTGGRVREFHAAGWHFHHRFQAPPDNWRLLPADRIAAITDEQGNSLRAHLTARGIDRVYRSAPGAAGELDITFTEPQTVSGIRLIPETANETPHHWTLEGITPEGERVTLMPEVPGGQYFWSGPRPYWGAPFFRLEARFPPQTLRALRMRHRTENPDAMVSVAALEILQPAEALPDRAAALPDLLQRLAHENIRFLYADRWESNRVHQLTDGGIRTTRDPLIFPDAPRLDGPTLKTPPGTGILLLRADAPAAREALQSREVPFRETASGPWVLFLPEPRSAGIAGLQWAGNGFLRKDAEWGRTLHAASRKEEGLALHPWLEAPTLRDSGRITADFTNGVKLRDVRVQTGGNEIEMTWDWELPRDFLWREYAVFVHFRAPTGGVLFQDDHVFMEDIPPVYLNHPGDNRTYRVHRHIPIPGGLETETALLRVGLYHRNSGNRIRSSGTKGRRLRAIDLPHEIPLQQP